MKIAIVGATSFIGKILIPYILKKDHTIVATYCTNNNFKSHKKIIWKKLDIKKNKKNYFKYLGEPDVLINLAWPDIPNYRLKKHFKTFYEQKKFNYNLVKNGLKNLIILGTCYEYGKVKGSVKENKKENPIIPYAIAKLSLLKSLQKIKSKFSFKFTWLRPFFVYGNNKKRKTLFTIIKDLEKNKIPTFEVNGSLVRDFVPVNFLCSSILKIASLNKSYGIVNISTGKGLSVKNFIKKNLKNKKNVKRFNMLGKYKNDFEPNSFWGNNLKLKSILKERVR